MTYHERSIAEYGYCSAHRPCDDCDDDAGKRIVDRIRAVMPVRNIEVIAAIVKEEIG